MKTKTLTVQYHFSPRLFTAKNKYVVTACTFRNAVRDALYTKYQYTSVMGYEYKLKIAKLSSTLHLPSQCDDLFTVVGTETRDGDGGVWESPMFVIHKVQPADYEGEPEVVHACIKYTNWIFGKTNIGDMFVVTDITRKELE